MKSYSRRELYAAGETLGDSATYRKATGGYVLGSGGGGSAPPPAPAPTQTTVQNTNVPEYAQPYVEQMLGAAQQQIFNYTPDANGNLVATGIKPYTPYSTNPQDYVAGFSPLQQQAQSNIANMQMPGQYGMATGAAGLGTGQALGAGQQYNQMATDPNAVSAFMNPFIQNTLAPAQQLLNQQYGMQGAQQQGQATSSGAFGGSRNALMQGLNEQNRMLAQNQLIGNAYNQAYNNAMQNMQYGANLGLQGAQAGIAGAGQLANIGNQQYQTALGINQAQEAAGAAQQAQQQNIINQQIQNYATAQQYPMMQLANMSGLLHGLPMQSATTQTYQAAPSAVSQLGGLGATALGAYGAAGGFKGAKGGLPKDFEKVKKFDVGGGIKSDLYKLAETKEGLDKVRQEAASSPSQEIRGDASMILTEKAAEDAMTKGVGQAAPTFNAASGGIVAFAGDTDGSLVPPPQSPGLQNVKGYMSELGSMGYGKPTEEENAIRARLAEERDAIKDAHNQNFWQSLMAGGAGAMASTSPFGGVGIGKGIGQGVETYAKGEKDLADQLNKLRSGELDLAKLNSTDRNNLLHYAMTGATAEQVAKDAAAARVEAAKLRLAQVGGANQDRLQVKLLGIADSLYKADLKEATDVNGTTHLTEDQKNALYQNAIKRAATMIQDINAAKAGGDKGGKGDKIPEPPPGFKVPGSPA